MGGPCARTCLRRTERARDEADNTGFTAGWTPDGRYVFAIEEVSDGTYYRALDGQEPALHFAVFGPFPVDADTDEVLSDMVDREEKARVRGLNEKLKRGEVTPAQRYGRMYEELEETILACPPIIAKIGSIESLTLQPERRLTPDPVIIAQAPPAFPL